MQNLPTPPTHLPVSMDDVRKTLSNWRNIQQFVNYLWKKYCKTFDGSYCLDSQKKYIEKYYNPALLTKLFKNPPTQEDILLDLSEFAKSRGSTLSIEFSLWIGSMSDLEFRTLQLGVTSGGGNSSRNRRTKSRKTNRKSKRARARNA